MLEAHGHMDPLSSTAAVKQVGFKQLVVDGEPGPAGSGHATFFVMVEAGNPACN